MSGPTAGPAPTADAVRGRNTALDSALLADAEAVTADRLHDVPAGDEWSPAHLLAHLGEFPSFFAEELRRWQWDRGEVVGRTHKHPGRLAVLRDEFVRQSTLPELIDRIRRAFADLAEALAPLEDADLTATTRNVKYGEEPLTAFLDRYVTGHKAGHLEQLRSLSARLDSDPDRT